MFDLIDEISELLYISDPETYELLYLNKPGQEMFGVSDISGKKCYRVLQGKDAPCEFVQTENCHRINFMSGIIAIQSPTGIIWSKIN